MSTRSIHYEKEFLSEIVKNAGYSGYDEFINEVMRRLSAGQKSYGENTFFHKPLGKEVMEEALDIAGWGTLWAEQISWFESEKRLSYDTGQHMKLLIAEAAAHAVRAYVAINEANELLRASLK